MSKFLMSAAAAALMTAPALAQSGDAQQNDAGAGRQAQSSASQTTPSQNSSAQNATANRDRTGAQASQDDGFDWNTSHDWVHAAVYGEDGEQVGVVDRVRMRNGGGSEVRALVLNTEGFLDQGLRHIRLLGDEATVITQDALPQGWTVSRTGAQGGQSETSGEDSEDERRWWNWGRDEEEEQESQKASANGGMDTFTLITLDFTNDEIGMMPEFTAPAGEAMASVNTGSAPQTETSIASDTTEGDSMTGAGAQRADSRRATQQAAQTARQEATGEQAMAANAGQTGDPMGEQSGQALSDEDTEDFQSAYGNEIGEDASDGYDREVRAGREDVGTSNDTGVNMQNGDAPDDIADSTLMDGEETASAGQAGASQSQATSDMQAEDMNAGATDMQRANRGGQAGDAADADNGAMTANDSQSGQAWADDESPADQLTRQGRNNGGDTGQSGSSMSDDTGAMSGQDSAMSGQDGAMSGQSDAATGQDRESWTEDNNLVGQDVYAQDDSRLGSVGRVQQGGEGTQAEPIALIIVTDTMGEREVSLEDRDWSNQQRQGEDSLTLDYQDQTEFQQDSAPYGQETGAQTGDEGYGDTGDPMENQASAYGTEGGEDSGDSDRWTDDHAWVDTAVYSRTGSQIGEIERVRGGSNGGQPTAIVLETNGFLDIGGREVELNGSNFRLTDYEGEQVLQIRYTEEEVEQMQSFNEANVSDYPLSDNPLEDDASEPEDDGTR